MPPPPPLVKTVMNRLSPVMSRLPAPSSAPITPPPFCCAPSPNTVSIVMPGVMYIIEPGFGHGALAWIQFDFDKLHFAADDFEVDLVGAASRHNRRRGGGAGRPGRAGQVALPAAARP